MLTNKIERKNIKISKLNRDLKYGLIGCHLLEFEIRAISYALERKIKEIVNSTYDAFQELLRKLESGDEKERQSGLIQIGIRSKKAILFQGAKNGSDIYVSELIARYLVEIINLEYPDFIQKKMLSTLDVAKPKTLDNSQINRLLTLDIEVIYQLIYVVLKNLVVSVEDIYDVAKVITELKREYYCLKFSNDATEAGISKADCELIAQKIDKNLDKIAKSTEGESWRLDGLLFLQSVNENKRYKGLTALGIGPLISAKLKDSMIGKEYFSKYIAQYIESLIKLKYPDFVMAKEDTFDEGPISVIIDRENELKSVEEIIMSLFEMPVEEILKVFLNAGYSEQTINDLICKIESLKK